MAAGAAPTEAGAAPQARGAGIAPPLAAGLAAPAFRPLPLGAVRPRGWLQRQLRIQADGLTGHLDEFWPDVGQSQWFGGQAEGWERAPYWLDGAIPLAWLLDDQPLKTRLTRYVDTIVARQRADGWYGPYPKTPSRSATTSGRFFLPTRSWRSTTTPRVTRVSSRPSPGASARCWRGSTERRCTAGASSGGSKASCRSSTSINGGASPGCSTWRASCARRAWTSRRCSPPTT